MDGNELAQIESTLALAAVLTAPNASHERVDVMATLLRVVLELQLNAQPVHWGRSIIGMREHGLLQEDMTTIRAMPHLHGLCEVPAAYAHAAESAWEFAGMTFMNS